MLKIGLVINPVAGVGGPAAMKGSDGQEAQRAAREQGIAGVAAARARAAFAELIRQLGPQHNTAIELHALQGAMGLAALADLAGTDFIRYVSAGKTPETTRATDTQRVVSTLLPRVDLLVFVGGDGTARDVLDARQMLGADVDPGTPVLGIPAGVKMHSGVFATSARAAGALVARLVQGGLISATHAEVKDIDEAALRRGQTGSVSYGELPVPAEGGYLQHVKNAGVEVEELVLLEIAAEVAESVVDSGEPIALGPGSSCYAIKRQLLGSDEETTLLGFDVICDGRIVAADANAADLRAVQTKAPGMRVVVSYSRGQGIVLGRGNQQLDTAILESLPPSQLYVVSSRTKLASLSGRPLLVDTGTLELDEKFSGLRQVISGYQDKLLYLVQPA